jgi:phosphoglycerate kinase
MVRTLDQLDLSGKRVFVRVDFNVPMKDGQITDDTRIKAALPTLKRILDKGSKLIIASHLGRPKGSPDPAFSLRPIAKHLASLLNKPVTVVPQVVGQEAQARAEALTTS